jgi:hypothetical protein
MAAALMLSLTCGIFGAVLGFGCYYLYPAQYTATGRIVAGGEDTASLLRAAESPAALSAAIVTGDLFHGEQTPFNLPLLVDRLRPNTHVQPTRSGHSSAIDLSLTYPDAYRAKRALDSEIRFIIADQATRGTAFPESHAAGAPVRSQGFDQGAWVLAGLIAGLLLSSVTAQMHNTAAPAKS